MKQIRRMSVLAAFLSTILLVFSGCSSEAKLEDQLSGKWKRAGSGEPVEINLAKKDASITLGGHVYAAAIEKVDQMSNTVEIVVNTEAGASEKWSLHQMWNDNGSTFTITLMHNGSSETLVPVDKS